MIRLAILSLLMLFPMKSAAYLLYTTSEGDHVKWQEPHVSVILDESLSKLGPMNDVTTVIIDALDLWLDKAKIPIDFSFEHGSCASSKNQYKNCVMACDNRAECYDREGEKGATTYLHYLPSDGSIIGFNIVFNAADWQWIVNDGGDSNDSLYPPDNENRGGDRALCLRKVSLHEIGHLLGIDHSEVPEAVMYYSMDKDDRSGRQLHSDDIQAAKALYSNFDAGAFADASVQAECSAVVVGRSPSGSSVGVALFFFCFWAIFRGRRETRRAGSCRRR